MLQGQHLLLNNKHYPSYDRDIITEMTFSFMGDSTCSYHFDVKWPPKARELKAWSLGQGAPLEDGETFWR